MPKCRHCSVIFDGPYRQKYCTLRCQFLSRILNGLPPDACWEWQGGRTTAGYGALNFNGKILHTHRVAYQQFKGEIPDGYYVCHHCDNPPCCNPAHLFVGTGEDNAKDMAKKGRAGWTVHRMPREVIEKAAATRRASGWKPSQEQIAASHAALAEKRKDPEWVAARRAKMSGTNNPNYGKKMSEETRSKLAEWWASGGNMKGKTHSEATKQKMREAALKRIARGVPMPYEKK